MDNVIAFNLNKEYSILDEIYRSNDSKSVLYEALDKNYNRKAVLKKIIYDHAEAKKNIETEIRCMINAEQYSPFVPTIYDYHIDANKKEILIVMQYLSGMTLREVMLKQKAQLDNPFTIKRNIELMQMITAVLSDIHKVPNLVHRDLKPENIIVKNPFSGGRQVYIIDFGISGVLWNKGIGTETYMAPEQRYDFDRIYLSQATDVFSLGLILFELFTGKLPVINEDLIKPRTEKEWTSIPSITDWNEKLPRELNELLKKALAYEPGSRYSNGRSFAEASAKIKSYKNEAAKR